MTVTKKGIRRAIRNINVMKESHVYWAEYFENNPNIEKKYIATGEWDTAEEHRNLISQYDEVLDILKSIKGLKVKNEETAP